MFSSNFLKSLKILAQAFEGGILIEFRPGRVRKLLERFKPFFEHLAPGQDLVEICS